jgi:DNA-binding response OmpR family regulator
MDLGLPGLDGFSVARQLRAEVSLGHVLLVALTGWGRDIDRQSAMDAGFDVYLLKPIGFGQLREILSKVRQSPRTTQVKFIRAPDLHRRAKESLEGAVDVGRSEVGQAKQSS